MMAKSYIDFIVLLLIYPFTVSGRVLLFEKSCNPGSIRVNQWPSGFGSLHVPKYTVQIVNEAWDSGAGVSDVRIACPGFASTTLIVQRIFRRLDSATCLLYDGGVIRPGQVITFDYTNILPYSLVPVSMKCHS